MSEKRAIFQEVSGSAKPVASNSIGIIDKNSNEKVRNTIQLWLKTLFVLIVLIDPILLLVPKPIPKKEGIKDNKSIMP